MKKIIIAGAVNTLLSLLVGGAAAWGVMHFIKPPAVTVMEAPTDKNTAPDMKDSVFITMPETLITLKDTAGEDHYMLIGLVFIADGKDKKASDAIGSDQPLYQSILVDTLSSMTWEDIRNDNVNKTRERVKNAFNHWLTTHKMSAPYRDVLVNKMVYQ